MANLSCLSDIKDKVAELSILLIGDCILDHYVSGNVNRISPESPIQVLDKKTEVYILGGAANVAINLRNLGLKVTLLTRLANDANSEYLRSELISSGVTVLSYSNSHPVSKKTRFISRNTQLLRVDDENLTSNSAEDLISFEENIGNLTKNEFKAILVSDYNKGVVDNSTWKLITTYFNGKEIVVDPKKRDLGFYKNATVIKPNKKEAQDYFDFANHVASFDLDGLRFISEQTGIGKITLTLGAEGVAFFDSKNGEYGVERSPQESLVDVTGAGDAFISVLTASLVSNLEFSTACSLATQTATWTCGYSGTKPLNVSEILSDSYIKSVSNDASTKTSSLFFQNVRQGKKIVFTNGCFDVFHVGHLKLLETAKQHGDFLVVAINDDESVKLLKGNNRPVNKLADRIQVLASLSCVDFVFHFSEQTPLRIIEELMPDVIVKGGEYVLEEIVGFDFVTSRGGEVVTVPMLPDMSSTKIIHILQS
jgi:D-beta-D-heptose 7-phosphate kinase/D-beta-D-heptose 1-phosphate adenosyltransferase